MAKVETLSRNNSPCFIRNDASLAELVNLGISVESSAKSEFDIGFLLSDNEISLEKQCFGDNNSKALCFLSEDTHVLTESMKIVNRTTFLDPLTKNLLKNDRTFSESCFESEIDLTDVLCTDNRRTFFTSVKNEDLENCFKKNDDKTSHSLSEDTYTIRHSPEAGNSNMTLGALAKNHLENDGTLSEWRFDVDIDFTDVSCTEDQNKCVTIKENTDSSNDFSLSQLCLNTEPYECSSKNKQEPVSNDYILDSELIPDIDLSFCIKKNAKISGHTSSGESDDSGFDETESASFNSASSVPEKCLLNTDGSLSGKENLMHSKKSLLFRAISAKPKIDDIVHAKLKKIKSELLKKQLSPFVIGCNKQD